MPSKLETENIVELTLKTKALKDLIAAVVQGEVSESKLFEKLFNLTMDVEFLLERRLKEEKRLI